MIIAWIIALLVPIKVPASLTLYFVTVELALHLYRMIWDLVH